MYDVLYFGAVGKCAFSDPFLWATRFSRHLSNLPLVHIGIAIVIQHERLTGGKSSVNINANEQGIIY